MSHDGLYFNRERLGFKNKIEVYVGPGTDPKCIRAVELCQKFQSELVVKPGFHRDYPQECPVIFVNGHYYGNFATLVLNIGRTKSPRAYIRKGDRPVD